MGLLGSCPRLFPWFLWEKIQKKTESVQAEREGGGWDQASPAGRSLWGPGKPRGPIAATTPILLSLGPKQGLWGWRLRDPRGPHIPSPQAKRNFMEPQESDPPRRLAQSQAVSTEPACHSRTVGKVGAQPAGSPLLPALPSQLTETDLPSLAPCES